MLFPLGAELTLRANVNDAAQASGQSWSKPWMREIQTTTFWTSIAAPLRPG
jgi:hypothetical protein